MPAVNVNLKPANFVFADDVRVGGEVVVEIVAAGGTALGLAADVTRQAEMQAMAQAAIDAFGAIDILCANAGIFPAAKLGDMTEADFDAVIATNLKGTFLSVSA